MKFKVPKKAPPLTTKPKSNGLKTLLSSLRVPNPTVFRIQCQKRDTAYSFNWYDLSSDGEAFETNQAGAAKQVRNALRKANRRLRYRIVQILEVDV